MSEKQSQLDLLMDLVTDVNCFQTPAHEGYIVLNKKPREVYGLKSKEFKNSLKDSFYSEYKRMPSSQALQDTISILEHRARLKTDNVSVRVGSKKGNVYLDRCDHTHRAIRINAKEVKTVSNPSVIFLRPKGLLPQPEIESVKSRKEIRRFMSYMNASETDRTLIIAWLLCALNPKGPYPILVLQGESGSGKTTIAKMLRKLIDPSIAPLRALPKTERDLAIAAHNNWVLAFDNVSNIPQNISDALCRLSTGGGLAARQLYTDTDETIFDITRPIILNGIGNIMRGDDLADRALVVNMRTIKDENRTTEAKLWKRFDKHEAAFLSALAQGVCSALKNRDHEVKMKLPRMADSLVWIVASESAIFKESGKFKKAYRRNRENMAFICLEADPLAAAVDRFSIKKKKWQGEANTLLDGLEEVLPDEHKERITKEKSWPKAGNALTRRLKEITPTLRNAGIEIIFKKESNSRVIKIKRKYNGDEKSRKKDGMTI